VSLASGRYVLKSGAQNDSPRADAKFLQPAKTD